MILKTFLFVFPIIFAIDFVATSAEDCLDLWSGSQVNKTIQFSMLSRKNKTGHWITNLSVVNAAKQLPQNWRVDVKHKILKEGELEIFHLEGKLIVPPSVPSDYQFYPGVGYYKYHSEKLNFDAAQQKCAEEGGHLALINSAAEHEIIRSYMNDGSAYLGFHDRIKEGEFITIFGESLSAKGYSKWSSGQPDDYQGNEDCGTFYAKEGLNDIPCDKEIPFICEYDLSWAQ